MWGAFPGLMTVSVLEVLREHSKRRRRHVIELSLADGIEKRHEKTARHQPAGGDEEHDDAHDASALGDRHRMRPTLRPITVSELMGMSTAVASGVKFPDSASQRPTAL